MNFKANTLTSTAMAATVLVSSVASSFAETKKAYCPPAKKHVGLSQRAHVRQVAVAPCDAIPDIDAEMARMQQRSFDRGVGGATDTWFGPAGQIMLTESAKISYDSAHGCAYNAHTDRVAGTVVLQGKAKFSIIAEPVAVVAGDAALGGLSALGAKFIAGGLKAQASATVVGDQAIGNGMSGIHTQLTATNGSVITNGPGASTNLSGATLTGQNTGTVGGQYSQVAGVNSQQLGAGAINNPYGTVLTGNAQLATGNGTLINGGLMAGSASTFGFGNASAVGGAQGNAFANQSGNANGTGAVVGSGIAGNGGQAFANVANGTGSNIASGTGASASGGLSGNALANNSGNTASNGGAAGGTNNTSTGDYGNAQSANGQYAGFNTGTNGVTSTQGTVTNANANLSTQNSTGAAGTIATGNAAATGGASQTTSCYNADNGSGNSGYASPNNNSTVPGPIYSGGAGTSTVKCKGLTL